MHTLTAEAMYELDADQQAALRRYLTDQLGPDAVTLGREVRFTPANGDDPSYLELNVWTTPGEPNYDDQWWTSVGAGEPPALAHWAGAMDRHRIATATAVDTELVEHGRELLQAERQPRRGAV